MNDEESTCIETLKIKTTTLVFEVDNLHYKYKQQDIPSLIKTTALD